MKLNIENMKKGSRIIAKCDNNTIIYEKLNKMWEYRRYEGTMLVWNDRRSTKTAEAHLNSPYGFRGWEITVEEVA